MRTEKKIHFSTFVLDYNKDLAHLAELESKCVLTEPLIDVIRVYICDELIDLDQARLLMQTLEELELDELSIEMSEEEFSSVR